jgi:hypothetical protein
LGRRQRQVLYEMASTKPSVYELELSTTRSKLVRHITLNRSRNTKHTYLLYTFKLNTSFCLTRPCKHNTMSFSKPNIFLPKSKTSSIFPSEEVKTLPDSATKRFLPIITLLRLFGVYPLKFGADEFGSGNTNNAAMIQYSVNLKSKSCVISMLTGTLLID